ncbi:hypothetical protein H5410_055907 [Solanum commersonii]|uniref:Uncharacterized protein n=1 Tax=Solanum commersonii TaxID=4109 RepID=A0A9J5WK56_SOLCO|nr:hypothetical protein H5410_055907 [Solanum commersonii]
MLPGEIHERAFVTSTTYPFPCLIFRHARDSECRSALWTANPPYRALDIGLIRDEANIAALREPRVEVPPRVQATGDLDGAALRGMTSAPRHRYSQGPPLPDLAWAPSSSVHTALEAGWTPLLHYIRPWMQNRRRVEARVERGMEG